jgi:hypothetical protein
MLIAEANVNSFPSSSDMRLGALTAFSNARDSGCDLNVSLPIPGLGSTHKMSGNANCGHVGNRDRQIRLFVNG